MNNEDLEKEIVEKGLTAPRVTLEDFEANIKHIEIAKHVSFNGQILRWAVITTQNGFAVTGDPSCAASAENDNTEIGHKIAIDNAKHKLWALMGYALKEKLHTEGLVYRSAEGALVPDKHER